MTIAALEQNVKIAADAYELELLFAGYNENAAKVVAALNELNSATFKLNRAKAAARAELEHAETCRIAAALEQAPTEAEALEILRKANEWEQDQRADAQHHREASGEFEGEDYAGLPDEDGRKRYEPVYATIADCKACDGTGHQPGDAFRTCGGCAGAGGHCVDPWPAGEGVFYR